MGEVDYFHFPISYWSLVPGAKTSEGVAQISAPLLGWVSARLKEGHSVLIQCLFGAHRAGATAIACLMHLSDLDAAAAISEARSRRKLINPHFLDFADFLIKLQIARREGLVDLAIKEAATSGYQNSMASVFGISVGGGKVVIQDSDDLDTTMMDTSASDFEVDFEFSMKGSEVQSEAELPDNPWEFASPHAYAGLFEHWNYPEGDSHLYASKSLDTDCSIFNFKVPAGGCATISRHPTSNSSFRITQKYEF
jgi:hypothetical protein